MSDEDGRYFMSKKAGWIYGSPRFPNGARILDEIVETDTEPRFAKVGEELVIREPPAGRFQIRATIWENDRSIQTLTIQKWRVKDGYPHDREHFSFVGAEVPRLLEFVQRLRDLHFDGAAPFKTAIEDLRPVLMTPAQEKSFLADRQDLVIEAATNDVTRQDIIALAYRRGQLVRFERLLTDDEFFAAECQSTGKGEEGLWQAFFEKNPWVLGHGLSYAFMTELDDRKLEQVVKGFDVAGPGKRADGLLKTHAHLSSLAFVEIKKHTAELVQKRPYRPGAWPPGADLVGGVAQCHAVVHAAGQALGERLRPNDEWGDPTGEDLLSVHPRCFLIIGRLSEFGVGATLNMSKFRSFESFRRNTHQPEILTYDELLYRARHIVDTQAAAASADPDGLKDEIDF